MSDQISIGTGFDALTRARVDEARDVAQSRANVIRRRHEAREDADAYLTITAEEIAAQLGKTLDWFKRKWRKLPHFPPPLPGCGLVWSRLRFEMWVQQGNLVGCDVDTVELARRALEDRIGGRAA